MILWRDARIIILPGVSFVAGFGVLDYTLFSAHYFAVLCLEGLKVCSSPGLEMTSGDISPTPPKAGSHRAGDRNTLRWVLNISGEGGSTTSLGSLFQCSVTSMKISCSLC